MTEEEIIKAIKKSGYLFESEISKFLADNKFFVESNVIFQDPITGKNREIDLVAETYNDFATYSEDKVSCKICYYFELKNNELPLVLMTRLQFNPNTPEEVFKEVISIPDEIKYDTFHAFIEELYSTDHSFYTQYCSFTQKNKKDEIMASHPDELYISLAKLCWYCEKRTVETNEWFEESTSKYFRHWLNVPVLLISKDLYELTVGENEPKLNKVKYSRLLLNFHYNDTPTSTVIFVVTKEHLKEWLEEMDTLETKVRNYMKKSRTDQKK